MYQKVELPVGFQVGVSNSCNLLCTKNLPLLKNTNELRTLDAYVPFPQNREDHDQHFSLYYTVCNAIFLINSIKMKQISSHMILSQI